MKNKTKGYLLSCLGIIMIVLPPLLLISFVLSTASALPFLVTLLKVITGLIVGATLIGMFVSVCLLGIKLLDKTRLLRNSDD